MKSLLRRLPVVILIASSLTALGVVLARPAWLPSWARLEGLIASRDDDDGDEKAKQAGEAEKKRISHVVHLASAELARQFGVETAPAKQERHAHTLDGNAEAAYNARRSAEILSRVSGDCPRGQGRPRPGRP